MISAEGRKHREFGKKDTGGMDWLWMSMGLTPDWAGLGPMLLQIIPASPTSSVMPAQAGIQHRSVD